ncbi:MAG: zinc ABC transporter substrate-binding protein [Clostridia bacterium]|nr:zinc ABC transporter substrate-binding protein [Clostridia bacterium]
MKRILCVMMAVMLITVCFCSCSSTENTDKKSGKLSIVTTIFPPYDFARQVAGDKAELTMLLKPGTESHNYDPTPQDIIKIQNADMFIYVGGESDKWVEDMLASASKKPKKIIVMMDCVDKLEEEIVEGMQAEEEEHGDEVEYDEHVWTSPKNAIKISKKICEELKVLDKDNEEFYEKNTNEYSKQLSSLSNDFDNITKNGKRNTMIFGDRFPFKYFADEYHLKYYAAFPGCSSETEPSAATVAFLIDKVKEEKIPVVFTIEFSSGKIADTICESTGAKKLMMHSCHNITQEQFESGITYIELMRNNETVLKEALS